MSGKHEPSLALELVGGETNAKTLSEGFSPQLLKAAEEANDAKSFVLALRDDALLRDECIRGAALAKRLSMPCGADAVTLALQPLLIYFDPKSFGAGRAGEVLQDEWLSMYRRALSDLPAASLDFACSEAIRTLNWFPKIAELRKFAAKHAENVRTVTWRIQKGAEAALEAQRPKPSKEQSQEVADGLRALLGELKPKGMPVGPSRPVGNQHAMADRLRRAAESRA